jgi:hypothetical protein
MEKPSMTGATAQKILLSMKQITKVAFSEEMDEEGGAESLNVASAHHVGINFLYQEY